jgi:hypothetical protein
MCRRLTNTVRGNARQMADSIVVLGRGHTCRAGNDTFALVRCIHGGGRSEVHLLAPREALIDDEDVLIRCITRWPASDRLLADRKEP